MTSTMGTVVIVLLAAILLALTNPSAEAHREALSSAFSQQRPLAGVAGLGVVDAHLSEYHSLVFASYTTQGEEARSIGALGVVFALDD